MKNGTTTQYVNRYANRYAMIHDGRIIENRRAKKTVVAFHFLGSQFTTNKNRQKEYSLDDKGWSVQTQKHTFPIYFYKIYAILTKRVHRLKK